MQPITIEAVASGADPVAVCLAQTIPNDETLEINGTRAVDGVVTFSSPRRLTVRGLDAPSEGIIVTVTGEDETGGLQVESFRIITQGVDVVGRLEFEKVTEVRANIGGVGQVQVGTSGVVGSNWARLDSWAIGPTNVQINVIGNPTYTLQTTLDDPNDETAPIDPDDVRWFPSTDTNVVNATGSKVTKFDVNPVFCRILVSSGVGTVRATILQTGGPSF